MVLLPNDRYPLDSRGKEQHGKEYYFFTQDDFKKKIDIIQGDIKEASRIFGAASFDVVTSNREP